mmetsp:Transcript_94727/g.277064  ORF Transcript_94727/g.277064 Transcript_94727/m.277064 type:complete len:1344 (+) Transcript_94727:54-4085(+)
MTGSLLLAVNGERHEVLDPDPVATLGDFLRGVGKTGVKIACGEGGCGACTVVVAEWCAETQTPTYRSVNACLVPLCSCDGMAVTTTEGLRPCGTGFHPLQERLAAKNGSQCGFCSPGMVMSMFGKLSRAPGPECPSAAEIEGALDGNLCRCTGYRAIIEAFQSFAGTPKDAVAGEKFAPFPDFLKRENKPPLGPFRGSGKEWIIPTSLPGVFSALREAEAAHPEATVSLVAGHTCRGIYKEDHLTDVFINLQNVPELTAIEKSKGGIRFGGSVTTTVFIETLEGAAAEDGQESTSEKNLPFSPPARRPELAALPVLAEHARRIAGHMVRNWGTIGGNLVMTKVKGFQSDLATILTGVGAKVSLLEGEEGKERELDADKFFSVEYQLPKHALLKSIFVPFLEPGEVFRSFKAAVRPQNSHAVVNAAFRVKMEGDAIERARLVFGAFGSRGDSPGPGEPEDNKGGMPGGPLRALRTEEVVAGKGVDGETLKKAVEALQTEAWWPEDAYERHLALGFLYKLFCVLKGPSPDEPFLRVSQTSDRPASKGSQKIAWAPPELKPIAEPSPKFTSKLQAAGDVRYANDLPEPKDCLYAAYVQVPRAKAIVKSIDCEAAMKMQGVFGVLTSEDIPGENASDGLLPLAVQTKLLVPTGEPCQYAGQPCLAIFADSTRHAELAAKAVRLELEVPAEKPLLSAEACMKTLEPPETESKPGSAASPVASVQHSLKRGDAEAALQTAPRKVAGEIFCNSQKHFYMETQVALAVPGEDNTLNIWQSIQVPSWAHETLRRVTGLPKHKIVVNIPMVGGGFGGKLFRGMHVGCVAAVAAMKWRRAVRFALNRNADIVMTGGRVAMTVNYEAGFDEAGKLAAVRVKNLSDCGGMDPCTGFATMIANNNMEQIYGIPNLDLTVWKCNTDKTPATAVRGPGEPQATFIMETILEHVAAELGLSPHEVREANIFTEPSARAACAADPTSPDIDKYSAQVAINGGKDAAGNEFHGYPALGIWEMLKKNADYAGKAKAVEDFNAVHRWRKRGLSLTPVKYSVSVRAQQATVVLYDDGSVLITTDATEIGQGLHTKVAQYAAYHLSQVVPGSDVPVDKIRVGPVGTDKIAYGSITGGSTSSEGCCEAVRDAIEKLKLELAPFKKKLEDDGKEVTYVGLVKAASPGGAEMQASGKCRDFANLKYHVFGACLSQVEVDVLTGETTILSADLLYDCGKSLNPLIDCGQAEGAFLMGVGFFLRENFLQSQETGKVISDGTWEYKIPCVQDVPLEFNVEFFPRPFDKGVASSKASGEPPLVLATSVFCALRQAVAAGRKEFGHTGHFRMDAPSTPRDIALAIGAGPEHMAF